MLPFRKILCPTDFSEPSYSALANACELAGHFGAELTLLHVTELPVPVPELGFASYDVEAIEKAGVNEAQKQLEDLLKQRIPPGVKAGTLVAVGDPGDQIVRAADRLNADLIVLATHGQTGWRHLVFGSVAEKVVRLAHCPVLINRAPMPAPDHKQTAEVVGGGLV